MNKLLFILPLFAALESYGQISSQHVQPVLRVFATGFYRQLHFVDQPLAPMRLQTVKAVDSGYHLFSADDYLFMQEQIAAYDDGLVLDTASLKELKWIPIAAFYSIFSPLAGNPYYEPFHVFRKEYGTGYCQLSFPLFNRAMNTCIFFYEANVGGLDPESGFKIYRKKGKKWKPVTTRS